MGRSQETAGKKEKEKNKAKRKKEKEERKEERKANSNKGKGLDDMLAYLDENGNITNTPPDPKRKKEINLEDIQLGAAKQEPIDEADLIKNGRVTFYNEAKGFGFIKEQKTGESIFVHANSLETPIKENDRVSFETEQGKRGPVAVRVKKI
ncbi:MAG TPA: cold shock domain-containing protein [Flavipsychrobacter sp.]|nr:cold shock domain-containing protein [Flavipsychrobacter sp.]